VENAYRFIWGVCFFLMLMGRVQPVSYCIYGGIAYFLGYRVKGNPWFMIATLLVWMLRGVIFAPEANRGPGHIDAGLVPEDWLFFTVGVCTSLAVMHSYLTLPEVNQNFLPGFVLLLAFVPTGALVSDLTRGFASLVIVAIAVVMSVMMPSAQTNILMTFSIAVALLGAEGTVSGIYTDYPFKPYSPTPTVGASLVAFLLAIYFIVKNRGSLADMRESWTEAAAWFTALLFALMSTDPRAETPPLCYVGLLEAFGLTVVLLRRYFNPPLTWFALPLIWWFATLKSNLDELYSKSYAEDVSATMTFFAALILIVMPIYAMDRDILGDDQTQIASKAQALSYAGFLYALIAVLVTSSDFTLVLLPVFFVSSCIVLGVGYTHRLPLQIRGSFRIGGMIGMNACVFASAKLASWDFFTLIMIFGTLCSLVVAFQIYRTATAPPPEDEGVELAD